MSLVTTLFLLNVTKNIVAALALLLAFYVEGGRGYFITSAVLIFLLGGVSGHQKPDVCPSCGAVISCDEDALRAELARKDEEIKALDELVETFENRCDAQDICIHNIAHVNKATARSLYSVAFDAEQARAKLAAVRGK